MSARAIEIGSDPDEGLLGLTARAERAIIDQTTDPVGVLHIVCLEPTDAHPLVVVEAAFVERAGSGVVERLEVHLGIPLPHGPDRETLHALLSDAGGVAFTSVCLRAGERELVDATLHFGSAIKLFGRCTALSGDRLNSDQVSACQHVLLALGLAGREAGGELAVPSRRFGGPPKVAAQVEALMRARERGIDVELYASTLPVTRSVRVALTGTTDDTRMLCTVSRQIPVTATSIARDAVALRDIVSRDLGFEIGARRWRVENAHGEREEHRPRAPLSSGSQLEWSLNWGARRRG